MNGTLNRIGLLGLPHTCIACWCVVLLILVSSTSAKKIEDIEKELVQKSVKIKSYTAKTETKQDMDIGQGNKIKSESKGTMEWMRKDQKCLYRMEMKGSSVNIISGKETKSKSTVKIICDGQFLYTLSNTDGQKMAIKAKAVPAQSQDTKSLFKMWRKDHNLKLLTNEKFDGKDCYVIEATPKKKDPNNPLVKSKFWLRKDNGIVVKMLILGKNNKPAQISTTTDIKLDAKIKPERFKFQVPKGVELIDMTKAQDKPADANKQDDTKPKPTETKEEPAKEKEQKPEKKKKEKGLKGMLKKVF
ncbi:MAG: LolA family protein [Planctomycetota bacterium]|jgi:outer membrane lipoprotein-sorting protein